MKKNTHQPLARNANANHASTDTATKPQRIISLSAELSRTDDDLRRRTAQRFQEALHRLCVLRSTMNETTYEHEWAGIFDQQRAMGDMRQHSQMLALAAVDVMQIQVEYKRMILQAESAEYDEHAENIDDQLTEALMEMRLYILKQRPD